MPKIKGWTKVYDSKEHNKRTSQTITWQNDKYPEFELTFTENRPIYITKGDTILPFYTVTLQRNGFYITDVYKESYNKENTYNFAINWMKYKSESFIEMIVA